MQKMREKERDKDLDFPSIELGNFICSSKRREISIFCCELFSNMNWKDRIWFAMTGNYFGPLQRTYKKLNMKKKKEKNK